MKGTLAAAALIVFLAWLGDSSDDETGEAGPPGAKTEDVQIDHAGDRVVETDGAVDRENTENSKNVEKDTSEEKENIPDSGARAENTPDDVSTSENDQLRIGDDVQLLYLPDYSEGLCLVSFYHSELKNGSAAEQNAALNAAFGDDKDKLEYFLTHINSEGNLQCGIIDNSGELIWQSPLTWTDPAFSN